MKQTAKPKTLLVVLLYLIVIGTVAVKVIFFPKSPLEKLQSRTTPSFTFVESMTKPALPKHGP